MDKRIEDFLEAVKTKSRISWGSTNEEYVNIIIDFAQKGFGFGEIVIRTMRDGRVFIDSETMGSKMVEHFLLSCLDGAIYDCDKDPVKHKAYNAAMQRECLGHCELCNPSPSQPIYFNDPGDEDSK